MNFALVYLALYAIVLVYITWLSSRNQNESEYLNSNKNLSAIESTWTTFASILTGYNFVIIVTFSYLYGLWFFMAFIGAGLAFATLYLFYKKRLVPLQAGHNLFSIGDYFGLQYGPMSARFVNTLLCGSIVLFLVLQMFINTALFSTLLHIGKISALLITTGVVCVYLWFGGFKVSVRTDIFQGILMMPIVLTVFFFPTHLSFENVVLALDPSQFWFAVGVLFLQYFSLLGQAESFQRVFASRDGRSLKKGLAMALLLLVCVGGAIAYLGINFKLAGPVADPSALFTDVVLASLPDWLGSLLVVSLIAAFMGTIDSSAFALGVLLGRTVSKGGVPTVFWTRIFTLGGVVVAAVASLYLFSFLSSVFALVSLVSVIGAALLVSLLLRPNALEMGVFLALGTLVFVSGLVFNFVTDNPLTSLIPSGAALAAVLAMMIFRHFKTSAATISSGHR